MITVAMPNHDDWHSIPSTLESLLITRSTSESLEVVIVDDASTQQPPTLTIRAILQRSARHGVQVRVVTSGQRLGVARARNLACERARGEVIVMTDAHVNLSKGWDDTVTRGIGERTMFAGTIRDPTSNFAGHGCTLVVPFMGTRWVRDPVKHGDQTQIASSAASVFLRSTWQHVGGYDAGMRIYGAIEPEFSVRAWLSGVRIEACPELVVWHRFKTAPQRREFLQTIRTFQVHNNIRFGLLYLDRELALEMVRHLSMKFPAQAARALKLIAAGDTWERRSVLEQRLCHDFDWFIDHFDLADQTGVALREAADRRN
jgi:polypeptide N-acetylgalactosaminyltransferase